MIVLQTIAVAFAMFSAIPVPQFDWNEKNMRYAMCAFPLIGVVIGAAWCVCGALPLPGFAKAAGFALIPVWITGGMEAEQAYRLSDFYILRADACTDVASVVALHHAMVLDYTGKMALRKKADIVSQPVCRCVDYIYDHINERITIQTLSEYTGLSVSYLSRVFKQNLGISISDYIREKKIEKAQNLLRYSDASLIDIANYLAFSSQSHFIQVFESLVGVSPKKYRDKYFNSMW